MRTAVVILNWNTRDYLMKYLPPLLSSVGEDACVIVADNASTDGSQEAVLEHFPAVRLLRFDRNYGFTGGYNRAFKAVCELPEASGMEYFVLINSDIEVTPGWLSPLVEWMDGHPDCAACGPKLHSCQDRDSFEYAGAAGGFLDRFGYPFCRGRVLKRVEKDQGQYDTPADVFWATGACLMVRRDDFMREGGLDDRFFAHMEEIDLCWRLQLEGRRVCTVPRSLVYHLGGGTLPNDSPWKLKLNYRNNLLMLSNNLAKTYALEYSGRHTPRKAASAACSRASRTIFLRMLLDCCSALVYLLGGKAGCFKAVIQAHREYRALVRRPGAEMVADYAASHPGVKAPKLYDRWIVPLALTKGNRIFAYLRNTL